MLSSANHLRFLDGAQHQVQPVMNYDDEWGPDGWPTNNSSFDEYCRRASVGGFRDLHGLVETQLGKFTTNVALDVAGGSDGVALQDLLNAGVIDTGIVTNRLDTRSDSARDNPHLKHIAGDILARSTWLNIFDEVETSAPDGLSLILFSPVGALQNLPPPVYRGALHVLLDLLRPEGVFSAKVPNSLTFPFERNAEPICESLWSRPDIDVRSVPPLKRHGSSLVIVKSS